MEANDFSRPFEQAGKGGYCRVKGLRLLLPFTPILQHIRYFEVRNQPIPYDTLINVNGSIDKKYRFFISWHLK
jgi:hypothetical protein